MWRIAEIETLRPFTADFAHEVVADTPPVESQCFLRLGHQGNLFCPVIEGDCRRGEGPKHVDDDCCSPGFLGVPHQAAESYIHGFVCSLAAAVNAEDIYLGSFVVSHSDNGDQLRLVDSDGVHSGLGDNKGAEINVFGVYRCC